MDGTKGSLDKVLRPTSSSRASPGCRALNTSMEILTAEPRSPEVGSPISWAGSHQRVSLTDCCPEENKGGDRENSAAKEVRTEQQTMTTFLQKRALDPRDLPGCISNSDSGDDSAETQTSKFCESSRGKLSDARAGITFQVYKVNSQCNETSSSNLEYSEEAVVEPQIQAAMKKMNKLDTVLAKKLFKERAIKKQGKEMRAKLWEELQSIGTTGSQEEVENTKLFLALISSWQDTVDPSGAEDAEIHTSVFHTEINPERYDCHKPQPNQDHPSELETNEFSQAEKTHSKSKNNQDFIKKNIELAKDSGSQIVMLERERKRLIELLKDTEDGTELQGLEEDESCWLAPGEGYTPEPMEFHHLNEIDIKLQVLQSDGDFSAISSSCSKSPGQLYQESLAYANRSLEAVPGEKVLRDNKEQRDQQNRLKEIDHQLKSLERNR
ncbi:PREDICTED: fibrous sheath-interacting protein 1, partial [Buceros rhinoceros silvestris]|uniref:fibrous sheath-interacting protein 1 n=1 Tax=Buceros rhinoceros silvestris TaxID=175836 RepID=UPI0005293B4A